MILKGRILLNVIFLMALAACRGNARVITAAPLPTVTPVAPAPTPAPIHVTVDGAVQQPGSYTLPPRSLVDDAVRAAGGPTDEADLERINLARELKGGHHVHVPRVGEVLPKPTPHGMSLDGRININLADAALLETLPKIGPTTAERIIEYRETEGPFETIEQIMEVKGIGPGIFEAIKESITVGDSSY